MTSELTFAVLASCLACACAQGYDASAASTLGSSVLIPSGGAGGVGGAATDAMGGMGGMPMPAGDPCLQADVVPCPCEGTAALGQRVCLFDMSSPTQGFLSECQGCPAPAPPDAGPMPMAGEGGMGGAAGSAASGGMAGEAAGSAGDDEEPTEPVDSCDGAPEGTPCDRQCLLPGNTANCNSRGECSCL